MELIKTEFASKGVVVSRIGGRSENQDCYGFRDTPLGQVVVVCDGMGGIQGGKVASTIAVNSILGYLASATEGEDVSRVLIDAIGRANTDIINTGSENPNLYGMGTTVTVLVLNKTCATIAYLGDSRIYQLRGKKKIFRTFDHSMVFEMVKNGVLTEEQARLSEQSNVIMKALGVYPDIVPDVHILPYRKGDRFILCSDGFWGAMPEKEFLSHVAQNTNKIANIIEHTANVVDRIGRNKGGNHDNMTAAIIDVNCNSLMKEKMSKTVKTILATLILLLAVSVALNVYFFVKYEPKPEVSAETTTAVESGDESKTEADSGESGNQTVKN